MKKIILSGILLAVLIVFTCWRIGLTGLWTEGIAFIANNTKDYDLEKGHFVKGDYSISIDLANLKSNIGKDLYNDGTYRIYVDWINTPRNMNTGEYRIGFRTSGKYSLDGATLISGNRYVRFDDHSFGEDFTAKMSARYHGKLYTSQESGQSGLNYKDGDEFAFYIFPSEAHEAKEISLNEKGEVVLTVSHLYKNKWHKR
jgi:hypothetical protein